MAITRRTTLAAAAGSGLAGAVRAETRANSRTGRSRVLEVAVIGAGVFGAWTARALKTAGASVALIDAYGAGNARSSSGGESRVIRMSYGGDSIYSPMALQSLAEWAALSARSGLPILHRTGVLWFSPPGDAYMSKSLEWLKRERRPHESLSTDDLARAYPQIAFRPGEQGFLEIETGALIAGRGVQTVVRDAGLNVVRLRADPPVREADGTYRVGPDIRARSVIYACGPWLPKIFPEVLAGRIIPTRQEVYHFGPAPGDDRFGPERLPVWADFNGGALVYGFPDLEGQGFKMAFDPHGPVVDPDTQSRLPSPDGIAAARAYLATRFPVLAEAPLIHARVCQYENSSNGDFLIDRLPGHERVWLVGGGSGHGFKHGPAVGRRVAAHILDPGLAIEPRFALATKAKEQNRAIY